MDPARFSRRQLLSNCGGAVAAAGLILTAGCRGIPRIPPPAEIRRNLANQLAQDTGSAPPPKQLIWLTPLQNPVDVLADASGKSRAWAEAMAWNDMLNGWRAQNPGIELVMNVISANQIEAHARTAKAAGTPLDVVYTDAGALLGAEKLLAPLLLGTLSREIVPLALAPHADREQVYALPVFITCLGLYIRDDRFRQADLSTDKPIVDWSTFEDTARHLTNRSTKRYGFDVAGDGSPLAGEKRYSPFLWTAGGSFFDPSGEIVTWNRQSGLDSITYLARLSQNYASPGSAKKTTADLEKAWLDGQTAMILATSVLSTDADRRKIAYHVQSVPAYIRGQSSSLVESRGANGAFVGSQHRDWAMQFVHYLATAPAQLFGLNNARLLPANQRAADAAPLFNQNPAMAAFRRILEQDDIHILPRAHSHDTQIAEIFRKYLGVALTGMATPERAWNDSAAQAQALLSAPTTGA